jgi:hypothetical protein
MTSLNGRQLQKANKHPR